MAQDGEPMQIPRQETYKECHARMQKRVDEEMIASGEYNPIRAALLTIVRLGEDYGFDSKVWQQSYGIASVCWEHDPSRLEDVEFLQSADACKTDPKREFELADELSELAFLWAKHIANPELYPKPINMINNPPSSSN